jgi:hypothetical protein
MSNSPTGNWFRRRVKKFAAGDWGLGRSTGEKRRH